MEKYQVSRITVRQVFDMLTHEGMVQRERGRGTFVTQPDIVGGGGYVYDFAYEMYQRSLTPSTRMISSHLAPVARETAVHLDIAIGDELVCIERLRLADSEPISVEESYLVHSRCPGLLEGHDFANELLREVLLNQYGLRLSRARQVVRAMAASAKLAGLLGVPEHFPLLFVERYTYTDDNRPLEYMRNLPPL